MNGSRQGTGAPSSRAASGPSAPTPTWSPGPKARRSSRGFEDARELAHRLDRETLSRAIYFRVRNDKVDKTGKVKLRPGSRPYKIGLGRAHKVRAIKLLIAY